MLVTPNLIVIKLMIVMLHLSQIVVAINIWLKRSYAKTLDDNIQVGIAENGRELVGNLCGDINVKCIESGKNIVNQGCIIFERLTYYICHRLK